MMLPRGFPGPDVAPVLAVIRAAGGRPMLVGGCVRDAIIDLGTVSKDIDIEVYGITDPDRLARALEHAGKVTEAGKAFGVFKVRAGGTEIDVSLPRRESKTGAGHRGFTVIPDSTLGFAEASARRDFTVNALMADPVTGEITDCHGGLADLAAGVLRHTSFAFAEDPLRVLRAVQFAARFGFTLAAETASMCRHLASTYQELPVERVWGEIEKIGTRGTHITTALQVLADTGWEHHFPQIAALHGVEQDPVWHPEGDVHIHSGLAADQAARLSDEAGLVGSDRFVVVAAALAHDFGKVTHTQRTAGRITSRGHAAAGAAPAAAFLRGIGCPEGLIARIVPLVREHMCCTGTPSKPAVRRLARRLTPATITELAIVCGADHAGRGDPYAANPADAWLTAAAGLHVTERPAKGILTGDHLIAAGMQPGPAFRPLLAAALIMQDAGEFTDEDGAIRWLKTRTRISGQDLRRVAGTARICQVTNLPWDAELGLYEPAADDPLWYMSFADPERPRGTQFLGAIIVQAPTFPAAVTRSHKLGINPGGAVMGGQVPPDLTIAPEWRDRLLNKEEATAAAATQGAG
jgi:tRNA nucleotidyltransferase (CCA-adding enzyme)